ncbi:hypothetical protein ACHMW6_17550 [Pseudoduganella sp. UC29_106]|uniref:hypothetical protein n=1 Tax=Pseudoduganella sp. UC29_106 TaxID=3374553 RepID=UPI003757C5CF
MLSLAHWSLPLGAIRKELAPLPGRYVTLWRYLIACAIVIVASLALQVPFLALSLVSIFSTTQQNTYLTRLSGLVCTIGLTLAVACTLLLLRLTFDVAFAAYTGSHVHPAVRNVLPAQKQAGGDWIPGGYCGRLYPERGGCHP